MKASQIKKEFTDFFVKNKHQKISSSSLVPQNDPTLLFTNAGMNQFKDYFTGKLTPQNKRAMTIQKVVRAGGKHNDLENVGFTARHHTFFEMMGNFSFGDYFKEEAIQMAWTFLTQIIKIEIDKLYITVHKNDDEAFNIWNKKIGLSKERIFKKGDKDNFWEMGQYGPCGPSSEIFYDHGKKYADPNWDPKKMDLLEDESRYVEIWNLVFMQYEKTPEGIKDLPNPSIDTGAGLERIAAVKQGVYWNYDTDCFSAIIQKIEQLSGKKYTDPKYSGNMRVVADHARSCTMLITDGVIPSNEGRGYVLRRIIRRAVRHLKELEINEVSFFKLVPVVFEVLGEDYPQNKANASLAQKLLKAEETKFLETLDTGLKYLNEALKGKINNNIFSGKSAFKLYDTYGFPLDLTQSILQEKNIEVNIDEFDEAMKQQKLQSKKSWKGNSSTGDFKIFHQLFDQFGKTQFVGYTDLEHQAKLLAKEKVNDFDILLFDKTPFYGESGGQAGDRGFILDNGNKICEIEDVQKPVDEQFIHFSKDASKLKVGQTYNLCVDKKNRDNIKKNHSATHLLQAALISILGDHIKQAGSFVSSERLRFDFTHTQAVTKSELKLVEQLVNKKIAESLNVVADIMDKDQAIKQGAMALFGEKYQDKVRVLKMGEFSTELCGGTHVSNTNEIGLFSILSESSLSSGIRRIEAITGEKAIDRLKQRSQYLEQIEKLLTLKDDKLPQRVESLLKQLKERDKQLKEAKDQLQSTESKNLFENPEKLNNSLLFKAAKVPDGSDLRKLSDLFVNQYKNGVVLLHSQAKQKTSLLIRTHKNNKKINCNELLKEALSIINGRGGGKSDMAQGSGDLTNNIEPVVNKVRELLCK